MELIIWEQRVQEVTFVLNPLENENQEKGKTHQKNLVNTNQKPPNKENLEDLRKNFVEKFSRIQWPEESSGVSKDH